VTAPELVAVSAIGAIPTVMSGLTMMAIRGVFASKKDQGERLGALEKAKDFEDGRRAGYAEGYADGAADRKRGRGE
jgi:hypothetical protein